jgi:sulfonate transport system substrate-binding protein
MSMESNSLRMKCLLLRTAIAVATMAIGICLFACSQTGRKPAGPPEKVTIACSATTDSVLAQVAQVRNYYREEGLEAIQHLYPYGKLALQEVLEGKADFATVAETPVMFAIMKGARISIIATIESSDRGNAVIARKDRGILTLTDLKGKKVAMTAGTTSEFFLDALLAVNGIAHDEVKSLNLKPEEMSAALANGDIDAISTFITYAIPAQEKLGDRGITFHDKNIYTSTFNIVATQEFIRKNPGKVGKLLRALVRAEDFVRQNPVEAQRIVADFSGVDVKIVRDIWTATRFNVSLDQGLLLALEEESRWAIQNRLTTAREVPNFLEFIYIDGLRSVKPEAVSILK